MARFVYRHILILILILVSIGPVSAQVSSGLRKMDWTVQEVKEWAEVQKKYPTWHGLLLYQGSDSLNHHFISRVMDEWVWFNIKRTELKMTDEQPVQKPTSSSGLFGYYYVDATKDFSKMDPPKPQ